MLREQPGELQETFVHTGLLAQRRYVFPPRDRPTFGASISWVARPESAKDVIDPLSDSAAPIEDSGRATRQKWEELLDLAARPSHDRGDGC